MKKTIFAALALVALASCSKENSSTSTSTDQVAATFSSAAITRVANNEWESGDVIGVTMTKNGSTDLADGDYYNVSYTVNAAGVTGTFSPTPVTAPDVAEVIYFPVDGSAVDFYAYCPYATLDANDDLAVDVSTQSFSDIDIVAAKASAKTKAAPTVTFTGTEAFEHQLSKITITLVAGDGITSLAGVTTIIKGQYTTAKYNLYTSVISSRGDIADITAVTATDGSTAEAILIPTDEIDGSSIVFTLDGDSYIWDTSDIEFEQGSEHNYEITVTKTALIVTGATINDWNEGQGGTGTAE
ncbi:MAG: fimbrillin family protein [Rikenellaceae bacterium]